jgi:predicted ABC-type ATPase
MIAAKTIFVFAGPNGSGKSTIVSDFISLGYASPNFICPDNLVDKSESDTIKAYISAMNEAEKIRNFYVSGGISFSFESVFSNPDKLKFLRHAQESGFKIVFTYVGTKSPDINILRVKKRVSEGGHDVPDEKIRSRYQKSLENLSEAFEIADKAYIFDNSEDKPTLILRKLNGVIDCYVSPPDWVDTYLLKKINYKGL